MTVMEIPEALQPLAEFSPEIAIILGSGLGHFADNSVKQAGAISYESIPGFPTSTVPGHIGRFVFGALEGRRVVCMQGRFHYYEGYSMDEVTLPVRLLAACGIQSLILTNAAGGINLEYSPGDFMMLSDHINFLGTNPLIGATPDSGNRFPDMTSVYDVQLRKRVREWAVTAQIILKEGVYVAVTGPSFETPAEIRFFRTIGADAVGMSTVPEAIVARQLGLRVLGFSCITNAAAGMSGSPLTHEEVSETAERVRPAFTELLEGTVRILDE